MIKEILDKKKIVIMILSIFLFLFLLFFYKKNDLKMISIQLFSIYCFLIISSIYFIFSIFRAKHVILYDENVIEYKIKNKSKQKLCVKDIIIVSYFVDTNKNDIFYVFVTEDIYGRRRTLHLNCKKYKRKDILKMLQKCIENNHNFKYDILNNNVYNQIMIYKKQRFN